MSHTPGARKAQPRRSPRGSPLEIGAAESELALRIELGATCVETHAATLACAQNRTGTRLTCR